MDDSLSKSNKIKLIKSKNILPYPFKESFQPLIGDINLQNKNNCPKNPKFKSKFNLIKGKLKFKSNKSSDSDEKKKDGSSNETSDETGDGLSDDTGDDKDKTHNIKVYENINESDLKSLLNIKIYELVDL